MEKRKYIYYCKQIMFKGKRMLFRVLLGVQHWTQYKTLVRDVCISLAVSVGMSQAVLYILEFVNYSLGWALDIEASDFINIVVAGIGVAGVLLALYCSNIAAVFSARYSQAPEEVFNLFVNSFITGAGVKAVLFYIAYSLCFVYRLWKISATSYLLTGVWSIFTIAIVLAFGRLGFESLNLTDAFRLLRNEYNEIEYSFEILNKKGLLAKGKAAENIQSITLSNLRDMAIVERNAFANGDFAQESLLSFMCSNIFLLMRYMEIKENIPFNSSWFPYKQVNLKWYEIPGYQRQMAVNLGGGILPKEEKNLYFIEQWISYINISGIPHLVEDGNLGNQRFYFEKLGKALSKGIPLLECNFIADHTFDIQNKWINGWGKGQYGDSIIITAESIGFLYVSYLVGILKKLRGINVEEQVTSADSCKNFEDIDFHKTIFSNVPKCRNLFEQINNELVVTGKRLTPDWFVVQFHAKALFEGVERIRTDTFEQGIIRMKQLLDVLLERKEYIASAFVLVRMREYHSKWDALAQAIKTIKENCRKYQRDRETYPWMEGKENLSKKWNELMTNVADIRMEVLQHVIAKHDVYGQWLQRNMDILGQLFDMENQWILECIVDNKINRFSKTYEKYKKIAISYTQIIARTIEKEDKNPQWVFNQVYKPIIDLILISGYVLLWGEIINDSKWKETVAVRSDSQLDAKVLQIFKVWKSCNLTVGDEMRFEWNKLVETTLDKIPAFKEECKRSMFPSSFENEGDKKNLVLKNCIDTSQGWCNIRIDAVMELYPVLILNKNVLSELQYRSNSYYWEAKQ